MTEIRFMYVSVSHLDRGLVVDLSGETAFLAEAALTALVLYNQSQRSEAKVPHHSLQQTETTIYRGVEGFLDISFGASKGSIN